MILSRRFASAGLVAVVLAGLAPAIAAPDAEPRLSLSQETALQCSALFAVVARDPAYAWARPPGFVPRAREYFVITTAALMDEARLNRDQVTGLFAARVQQAQRALAGASGQQQPVMRSLQPCLGLLDREVPLRR